MLTINAKLCRCRRYDLPFLSRWRNRVKENLCIREPTVIKESAQFPSFLQFIPFLIPVSVKQRAAKYRLNGENSAAMHFVNTLALSRITPSARISAPVFNY